MSEDITIADTKGGKPVYRLPRTAEPLSFMQKYLGEATFTALSLTAIVKVASVLALGAAAATNPGLAGMVTGEAATSFALASEAGAGLLASVGAAVKGLGFGGSMAVVGAGGVAGALVNKRQVEKKAETGVEIAPPSRLNSGIFRGGLSGFVMGAGLPMAAISILGSFIAAIPPITGGLALGLVAVGVASAAYGAFTQGNKHYEKAEADYEKVKYAYEIQEGIQSPVKARVKEATNEIAKAATIGAVGAGAGVDVPEVGTVAGVGAAVGLDEAPQQPERWHPAQDKPEGHSFAAKVMAERESKMLGDAAKEIAGTFMGTR